MAAAMGDEDFRALIERATQLEDLTKHPGWVVLVDYLEDRMVADKKAVLNGLVKDRDDYLHRTGILVGISAALQAPETVAGLVQNERDRRKQ